MPKASGIKTVHTTRPPEASLARPRYDQDYFAWIQDQVVALKDARLADLDLDNLAEEVGDLGISEKRELESRLLILLVHLLKWRFQPSRQSHSWKGSIVEQRTRIKSTLRQSPSLANYPALVLEVEYDTARLKAAGETKLPEDRFPRLCPFTIDQILDPDFYPEAAS